MPRLSRTAATTCTLPLFALSAIIVLFFTLVAAPGQALGASPGSDPREGAQMVLLEPAAGDCYAQLGSNAALTYTTVQAAVDAALPAGDLVKVAGTCVGVGFRGGVTQTVYLSKSLTICGGYTVTNWTTSNPAANPTTLDAGGLGRVLYITGNVTPTIEGLRITGGDARGLQGGSPDGEDVGGGIYIVTATAIITNNAIFGNVADGDGGGIYMQASTATLTGNSIHSNVGYGGGGLNLVESPAVFVRNIITGNTALEDGGGLRLDAGSDAVFTNTVIADNMSNVSAYDGGGSGMIIMNSAPRFWHTTIARNWWSDAAVVVYNDGAPASAALTNTIFVGNGVGISATAGATAALNGVLWLSFTSNTGGDGTINVTNAITGQPYFLPDGYHIRANSAAIDAGLNAAVTTDINGQSRPQGGGYDLGADEYPPCQARLNDGAILTSVQAAVDASASAADVVKVAGYCSGVSSRSVSGLGTVNQTLVINNKSLTVRGGYTDTNWVTSDPAANFTTLDARGNGRPLLTYGGAPTVDGLRLTNGDASKGGAGGGYGGGVYSYMGTGTIANTTVISNYGYRGGGIYLIYNSGTIANSSVLSNTARDYGGGIYIEQGATVTVTGGSVSHNKATTNNGGGIYLTSSNGTVTGATIASNSSPLYGGGIYQNIGVTTIGGNTISGNSATQRGGGVYLNQTGATALKGNTIVSNTSQHGGGGYLYFSNAPISGNSIISNTAYAGINQANGGGLYLDTSNATITTTTVMSNSSRWAGGGLYLAGGTAVISGNTVISNTSGPYGGGLYANGSPSSLTGNTFSANRSDYGGGVYLVNSHATLNGNTLSYNKATNYGGGMYAQTSNVRMTGDLVTNNAALTYGQGGGLAFSAGSTGRPSVLSATVAYNTATRYGGGIWVVNSPAITIANTQIVSNTAAEEGGGLYLEGSNAAVTSALIVSNTAQTYYGGGVYANNGNLGMTNGVIAGNQAGAGGGVYASSGSLDMINGVIADNQTAGSGSALFSSYLSPNLAQVTIARNSGGDGSGMFHLASSDTAYTLSLTNTILAEHAVGIFTWGGLVAATLDGVLWDSNTENLGGMGSVSVSNETTGAADFAADGYHITEGSAAIDAGVNSGVATDIDGEPRPMGPAYDLGADEFPQVPVSGLQATSSSPTALGQPTTLTATLAAGTGVTYTWDFGDNAAGSGRVVQHTYAAAGAYVAVVTATNSMNWMTATTTVDVVSDLPISGLAAFNDGPTTWGLPTTLSATVSGGTNVAYAWSFGDGGSAAGWKVTHTYALPVSHTAVVTASNSVSAMTATTVIDVLRVCVANLNGTEYPTVQAAVDTSASPADVVKVAGYCAGVAYTDFTTQSVKITKDLTLRGGYTFTDWTTSNPAANPTTLDALGQGPVVRISGSVSPTVEGLRITNGAGGGVVSSGASPVITGCHVYSNTAGNGGGVAIIGAANARLVGNTIHDNRAQPAQAGWGGGVLVQDSDNAVLTGNRVYGNRAEWAEGGVWIFRSNRSSLTGNAIYANTSGVYCGGLGVGHSAGVTLSQNDIYSNRAETDGGGACVGNSPGVILSENKVYSNTAGQWGAGLLIEYSNYVTVTGNQVYGNTTPNDGAGLYVKGSSHLNFAGNRIAANESESYGGGMHLRGSDATLTGNVFSGNRAQYFGGALLVIDSARATLEGNRFYNNRAAGGGGVFL